MQIVWKMAVGGCATLMCAFCAVAAPKHWDVLGKYCTECHNTTDWAGGIAFDALNADDIPGDAETWEKAIRKLRTGMMPPVGKPRPPRAVLDDFAGELAVRLDKAGGVHPYPGTTCSACASMRARCCPPTIRPKASTTSQTC
jgi:hypothetical protein